MTVRRVSCLTATALLLGLVLTATSAAHPPKPTSPNAALRDGCQRSDFGIGFATTPEWVYVYRNPAIRMASGIVRVSHPSNDDSILEHRSYDYNGNLVPDARYRYLIAGNPSSGTNNYAAEEGEARGRLHFEWESATLPFFAWPTDGDRATLWGSWIWDCGHWESTPNNTGGVTTGEHSELHPLSAIVVNRRASYLSATGETETDAFISNQGDNSHAVERCALTHHPVSGTSYPQYDSGFEPCATDVAHRIQPLARSYTFFVPAPPRPSPTARLRYRILTRIRGGSGSQHIRVLAKGLEVTVVLHNSRHVVRYGKSFFVSWSGMARPVTTLRVTFKAIRVVHADPMPSDPDPSGAHWVLYLNLNGYWRLLNTWAPGLTTHVFDGKHITLNRTVTIHVPRGARVWLQVQGGECDAPAGKKVLGIYAHRLYPCPNNTDEQNPNIFDVFNNDDPGTILDIYRSAIAAIGTHVSKSASSVNFPGTGPTSFGTFPGEGQGDYRLTYTVRRARN